ncbi:hypothetical protein AKO1_011699 [Acrasis kona]|uniref:Uncharacterized protein n=1 Tax=Acrasis kona TaxID=1008807 RepID=A0AAW2Z7T2_9EUKA
MKRQHDVAFLDTKGSFPLEYEPSPTQYVFQDQGLEIKRQRMTADDETAGSLPPLSSLMALVRDPVHNYGGRQHTQPSDIYGLPLGENTFNTESSYATRLVSNQIPEQYTTISSPRITVGTVKVPQPQRKVHQPLNPTPYYPQVQQQAPQPVQPLPYYLQQRPQVMPSNHYNSTASYSNYSTSTAPTYSPPQQQTSRDTPQQQSPIQPKARRPSVQALPLKFNALEDASPTSTGSPESSSRECSDDEDTSSERSIITAIPIPTIENPTFNYQQLQPIRILAYQVGLSRDPNKSWRYRDIKRALFEKCSKDQLELLDKDQDHAILKQRLPHKLSLAQFCKRLVLLVFHFIVRDGRDPKFWRKKTVRQDLVRKILCECENDFYQRVNVRVAVLLHSYVAAGMTVDTAMKKIEADGNLKADV